MMLNNELFAQIFVSILHALTSVCKAICLKVGSETPRNNLFLFAV